MLNVNTVLAALLFAAPIVTSIPAPSPAANVTSTSVSIATSGSGTETASSTLPSPTVPFASDNLNDVIFSPVQGDTPSEDTFVPEPIRGTLGAAVIGPQNIPMDLQNPDLLGPPTTDSGLVGTLKWPFSLSKNRLATGGWARQQNEQNMPLATSMAGVNMRLEPGAIRELHWHTTPEWSYVLKGSVQVSAVNSDGQNFLGVANEGDIWYFPPGIPHSLQATNTSANGTEFLLVFGDGAFSEDSTFLLTDWLAHVPKEVLAKNFQTNVSAFDHIPSEQLYIFPSSPPAVDAVAVSDPQGTVPQPFVFQFSQANATQLQGGSAKVIDSRTFPVATAIAAAEVTVNPGSMRELHWHPTQDEWSYFLEGNARVTVFASSGTAETFNYQPGDIGFVPASMGHYVENLGNTTVRYLEIFNSDIFQDISLQQWLALTPPDLVKAHLQLSDETIANLSKEKLTVV